MTSISKLEIQIVISDLLFKEYETYHHWRVFAGGSNGVCMS